jgi:UDP-N-acetylmuramyl pentapeptide phosphotransferase/UDP-N-acetylglucosamine-1-phosphate transferase
MTTAVVALLSFAVAVLLTRILSRPGTRLYVLDVPNDRSLHDRPTPRTGGVAIVIAALGGVAALLVTGAVVAPVGSLGLASGALLVAAVSLWDDRGDVSPLVRLAVQAIAAGLVVADGWHLSLRAFGPAPTALGLGASVVLVVWLTNLYNFMDGMDGFAGGMGAAGFGFLASLAHRGGHHDFGAISLVLAAANLGFLTLNLPPARIFMGDVGSATMGFLVGGLTLWGLHERIFPLWAPLLVFSPFIVDASVTLALRLVRGERFWLPHRTHYYQRLVRLGWGHRRTVLWEYALMAAAGTSTLLLSAPDHRDAVAWGLGAWAVLYAFLAQVVRRLESAGRATTAPSAHAVS